MIVKGEKIANRQKIVNFSCRNKEGKYLLRQFHTACYFRVAFLHPL